MSYKDKDKQRKFVREWMAARRAAWLSDKICVSCGSKASLEVHHCNPAEKVTHSVWSWAAERRAGELQKCIVLCHTCHMRVTISQQTRAITHGTNGGYSRGCRCRSCRDGHAAYVRNRRRLLKGGVV